VQDRELIITIRIKCETLPTQLSHDRTRYWNLCKEEPCLKTYISWKLRVLWNRVMGRFTFICRISNSRMEKTAQ
jgi:hypothetical protein